MDRHEFNKAIAQIVGVKKGRIISANVGRLFGNGNKWLVTLNVELTEKQIAQIRKLIQEAI